MVWGKGTVQSSPCHQADVKRLEAAVDSASRDVDIFLTCEWPAGVTAAVPAALQPQGVAPSAGVAALCVLSTCRGHAACTGCQALEGASLFMGLHDSCALHAFCTA